MTILMGRTKPHRKLLWLIKFQCQNLYGKDPFYRSGADFASSTSVASMYHGEFWLYLFCNNMNSSELQCNSCWQARKVVTLQAIQFYSLFGQEPYSFVTFYILNRSRLTWTLFCRIIFMLQCLSLLILEVLLSHVSQIFFLKYFSLCSSVWVNFQWFMDPFFCNQPLRLASNFFTLYNVLFSSKNFYFVLFQQILFLCLNFKCVYLL